MKGCALLVLFASTIMACEGETKTIYPDIPIGVKPGTRLSPKLLLADDGTMFLHPTIWKDSEYGECVFRTAADGEYRCLPDVPTQVQPYYLDPSCAQEVFIYQAKTSCVPMGLYALVQTQKVGCSDATSRVMKAGKMISAVTLYVQAGATCQTIPIPINAEIYLVSDEVPAGEFVSAWR